MIKKKPAPTTDRGDGLDNCGSAEGRRGITSLRFENSSSRIGTRVMDEDTHLILHRLKAKNPTFRNRRQFSLLVP
jgi:hypothetical protein